MVKICYIIQFDNGSYWGYSGTPTKMIQQATMYARKESINLDWIKKKEISKDWNRNNPKILKIKIEVLND